MADALIARFRRLAPAVDFCSMRLVERRSDTVAVRQDVPEPPATLHDRGAMFTVVAGDGIGYAASSDLSEAGIRTALARAAEWARLGAGRSVFSRPPQLPTPSGRYASATRQPVELSKAERIELLMRESRACRVDDRVVDWGASLWTSQTQQRLVTADGGDVEQQFDITIPSLHVTAHADGLTQTRSWGGRYNGFCQQGGFEVIERSGFIGSGAPTADEALQLLMAPNCPCGRFDIVLMPDQMMLQIHESIGHPLELDRILGDERNYAGTSFVTLDMFGQYRYGSSLLNVTYDPTRSEELASFAFDDDGAAAARECLIKDGVLMRPLGGGLSQQRAGIGGVANTRACNWNRPPIDRMANLNVEAGGSTFEQLIESTADGILMQTNVSWSIDDSRNKFQFGCEWGRRIREGRPAEVVRNPNYRGVSATFWRSLSMVGDAATVEVLGTPYCGKGEPNQAIPVGHASPACKFSAVDVFGAER